MGFTAIYRRFYRRWADTDRLPISDLFTLEPATCAPSRKFAISLQCVDAFDVFSSSSVSVWGEYGPCTFPLDLLLIIGKKPRTEINIFSDMDKVLK